MSPRSRVRLAALVLCWLGVLLVLTGTDRVVPRDRPLDRPVGSAGTVSATEPSPLGQRVSPVTLSLLAVLTLALWANAAANTYRFNVAIAVLGSIPLTLAVARARSIRA